MLKQSIRRIEKMARFIYLNDLAPLRLRPPTDSPEGEGNHPDGIDSRFTLHVSHFTLHASHFTLHFLPLPLGGAGGGADLLLFVGTCCSTFVGEANTIVLNGDVVMLKEVAYTTLEGFLADAKRVVDVFSIGFVVKRTESVGLHL